MNLMTNPSLTNQLPWLLQEHFETNTVALVDAALMSYFCQNKRPIGGTRLERATAYVYDRLLDAADHVDVEYGSVSIPEAIKALELALSIEIREGDGIPEACELASLMHRLLSYELKSVSTKLEGN